MPETTQFGETDAGAPGPSDGKLRPNTVLMARYRILAEIGGGGMGTVYQARDTRFPDAKRLVAVKEMLTPDSVLRATALKTFQREANILATLSHPAIPKIFDFFDQNDRAYLIMEYINGSDLDMLLSKTRELPVEKVLEWAIELCDVLDYLHNYSPNPIIFRDLKPANIMIDSLGKVRLIDFGIAKIFNTGIKHTMIGTEGYSAPEQYKGDVTPLSDIYGLGATLHHILTRKDPRLEPPFSFRDRPLTEYNSKVQPMFIKVIERALSDNPNERFQSCAEMKAALEQVRYGGGSVSVAASPAAPNTANATGLFDDMDGSNIIEPRWKFETEDEIRSSPTAYNGVAYVGSYDTNVWALNLENGEFIWKFATGGGIASSPIVDRSNKLVLFGSEDNTFYAVDYRTGRINWSYVTKGKIRSTGRIAHDHVFFGSDDGHVYALVAGNGRYLWDYDMASAVRTRPVVTNDLVIVGAEMGEVVALELSGKRKWAFRAKRGVNSSPFVDLNENLCFIGGMDGFVYALDATSGFTLWRFRTNGPIVSSPVCDEGTVYFGSVDGHLYAVSADAGRERWRFALDKPIIGTPVAHQGNVYFGGTDNTFYCVNGRTGKEQWRYATKGQITSTPFVVDNIILFGSMDRTLYALPLV